MFSKFYLYDKIIQVSKRKYNLYNLFSKKFTYCVRNNNWIWITNISESSKLNWLSASRDLFDKPEQHDDFLPLNFTSQFALQNWLVLMLKSFWLNQANPRFAFLLTKLKVFLVVWTLCKCPFCFYTTSSVCRCYALLWWHN